MTPAIQLQNLDFSYGTRKILHAVNASFYKQRFSVLLGTNGSGKSTLFQSIGGILTGYGGRVLINGHDVKQLKTKTKAGLIGFLPQFYQTAFPFTVEDILLTGRAAFSGFQPTTGDKKKVVEVLEELEITSLYKKRFTELSGGEQQMVMIGRLLMQNPEIIVLDEPTNHLDVYYQNFLMEKLRQLINKGHTVIAVMHNPTLAYLFADDFYFLHQNVIMAAENMSAIDLEMLKNVYRTNFVNFEHKNLKIVLPIR